MQQSDTPVTKKDTRIPMIAIISEMVEQTPDEIEQWTKEDWLAFAKWLGSSSSKTTKIASKRGENGD